MNLDATNIHFLQERSEMSIQLRNDPKMEGMLSCKVVTDNLIHEDLIHDNLIHQDEKCSDAPAIRNTQNQLLWKLSQNRKDAFEAMNSDIEVVVDQCLKARRYLQTVEDSNRTLSKEFRNLRSKYEALLEKNKKDTGIIMKLKDSEYLLKKATKSREETNESLLKLKTKNKERSLERKLLQDELSKLLLKSQTMTNKLNKTNIKHQRIQSKIEIVNKIGKEAQKQQVKESDNLRIRLKKHTDILEKWLEINSKRNADICRLQEDIKSGLMVYIEKAEDEIFEKSETNSTELEVEQTDTEDVSEEKGPEDAADSDQVQEDPRERAIRREWMKKKTLWEVAEKQMEHLMNLYMVLNKRLHDLNVEIVCVREWRIDKEAQRRELTERAAKLEQLVELKRRKKLVPPRSSIEEMAIWIKVQQEVNEMLRDIDSNCLSIRAEDFETCSGFLKTIKEMYVDSLKEDFRDNSGNKAQSSEKVTENDNST